jgi:hypothetical protein
LSREPLQAAPRAVRESEEVRNHLRCVVCGVPWQEHTDVCSRHPLMYLHACVGVVASGLWACCDHAGVRLDDVAAACPHGCGCHTPDPLDREALP